MCSHSKDLNNAPRRSVQERACEHLLNVPEALRWSGKATGPCTSADYKRQKDSAQGAVNLYSTGGFCQLQLIPLGSLQGAVSAFTCCGNSLAVVEDWNQRTDLGSICCSVFGKSSAITDP